MDVGPQQQPHLVIKTQLSLMFSSGSAAVGDKDITSIITMATSINYTSLTSIEVVRDDPMHKARAAYTLQLLHLPHCMYVKRESFLSRGK